MKNWRILPTGLGIGFLLVTLLLFLLGVNFSNNLIFTLSFFLMSAFLLSVWLTLRNLSHIEIVNVRVKPVHCGQKLDYQISVKEVGGNDHLYLQLLNSDSFYHLYANDERVWHVAVEADQRGLIAAKPLVIHCIWPLGLFSIKRSMGYLPEVLVYPQAANQVDLTERHTGKAAHSQSEADELDGLREYQSGDNIKRIDWRAMARRQQLQVKHFDGAEGDPSLWLEWQATEGMEYEKRIECLCHWVLECQQAGREFGLRIPQTEMDPQKSGQHVQACLAALAVMPEEAV